MMHDDAESRREKRREEAKLNHTGLSGLSITSLGRVSLLQETVVRPEVHILARSDVHGGKDGVVSMVCLGVPGMWNVVP